ncbi:MAG: hypothetical protein E7Z92_05190 [Cyanobacteria bacterium SIG31]|nr:hypothetical protein [Cyanobacteria bacterium SIG31]
MAQKVINAKRNPIYDIAKEICILFVVAGHCNAPMHNFYTSFHVLFFFILAGMFFNEQSVNTFNLLKQYIIKIWKRYAKPYILCNLSFLLFYNLFIKYYLITVDPRLNSSINYLTTNEIAIKALKHITLVSSSEILCGATWFLKSLFWGLLSLAFLNYILNSLKIKKTYIYFVLIFLCEIALFYFSPQYYRLIFYYAQTFLFLLLGELIKNFTNINQKNSFILFILTSLTIFGINNLVAINFIKIPLLGIFGFYFVLSLSIIIQKYSKLLNKIFEYVGQHTISILCLHFLAFKIVTYFIIIYNSYNLRLLGSFPVLTSTKLLLSILYLVGGITIPLLIEILNKNFKYIKARVRNG